MNFSHKKLNLVLNFKKMIIYLNKKYFDSIILQDKLLCIYHSFTMEMSLP